MCSNGLRRVEGHSAVLVSCIGVRERACMTHCIGTRIRRWV